MQDTARARVMRLYLANAEVPTDEWLLERDIGHIQSYSGSKVNVFPSDDAASADDGPDIEPCIVAVCEELLDEHSRAGHQVPRHVALAINNLRERPTIGRLERLAILLKRVEAT